MTRSPGRSRTWICLLVSAVFGAWVAPLHGQAAGSYGGQQGGQPSRSGMTRLPPEEAGAFITIDGSCELRLPAESLRIVFAVTSDAPTPLECWKQQREKRDAFVSALADAGITGDEVQVDFISMLPVFGWKQEERESHPVLVERLDGHRLQENVHVAVADEPAARKVIELALDKGVSDVIAVDYWSSQTQQKRRDALATALAEAQLKAKLLLAAFPVPPALANVQEETQVLTPGDLYQSFENVYAGGVQTDWHDNLPRIFAPRPRNTFYAGFTGNVDRGATTPAMRPEISVVSTVVLYYESPAHERTPAPATPSRVPSR